MSADKFNVKQRTILVVLIAGLATLVFGASYAVEQKNKSELATIMPATTVASVQETQVLGTQISKTGAYSVTAGAAETQGVYVKIPVQVTNTSDYVVQFSPGLQFKLVGVQSKTVKTIEVPSGAVLFAGGPIAAGQTLSGDVYFMPFEAETYDLVFYPDVEKEEHAVVPMAAQPAVVQSTSIQQKAEDKKQESENESEDD